MNTTILMKGPGVGNVAVNPATAPVYILPIPNNISQAQGTTLDMSQYIVDNQGLRTDSDVYVNGAPLPTPWFVSYNSTTEELSFDNVGQAQDLTLEVTWSYGDDPLDLPLLDAADANAMFTYQGQFDPHPSGSSDLDYSGGGITVDNGTMYIGKQDEDSTLSAVTVENVGGTSSLVHGKATVPGDPTPGETGGSLDVTGSYIHYSAAYPSGRLIVSRTRSYDASGKTIANLNVANKDLTNFGGLCWWNGTKYGLDGSSRARAMSGAINKVPDEWQDTLGGDTYIIQTRPSIVSQSVSTGFSFGVFNGDDVPQGGGAVNIIDYMWYAYGDRIFNEKDGDAASDYFSYTTASIGTAFIVPGTRTLAYVHAHGYGLQDNPPGCRGSSSTSHWPYRTQITLFDMRDIVNSTSRNSPRPYGFDVLGSDPYGFYGACAGDGTYDGCMYFDVDNNKFYSLMNGSGEDRGVDVWTFNIPSV